MWLTALVDAALTGGTLVKYRKGFGLREEFGRARIERVGVWRDRFLQILTSDEDRAFCIVDIGTEGNPAVTVRGRVFVWVSSLGWWFAAASRGVSIPAAGGRRASRGSPRGSGRGGCG